MGAIEQIGMLLQNVPRDTKIRVLGNIMIPPESTQINIDDELLFKRMDGVYGLCYKGEEMCFLSATTQVEIIK